MGNNPDSHTPSTSDRSGNVSPFGEDVSQLIRTLWFPWTLNSRMGQGQVGLFNTVINEQQTGNAEQERNIVTGVASYGKQLGRINDALSVLISLVVLQRDPSKLHADERQALQDFSILFRACLVRVRVTILFGTPEDLTSRYTLHSFAQGCFARIIG
jgi:hypothetical protein